MYQRILLGFALVSLAAVPALSQSGQQAAAPNAQPTPAPSATATMTPEQAARANERVCRTERATGSLTRVNRVCMTRAEWAALEEQTRNDVNRATRPGNSGSVCTGMTC